MDFQLLFEQSPDVLLVLLPDAPRYTQVAATKARLAATMTTLEQTIGRGLFEMFPDNPDDPSATGMNNLRASLERVLRTKTPDTMAVQKYDIRGPDGSYQVKYWSPKNIPILSASGEVLYIFHRVEDVTELVIQSEAGQELRDRTKEMEREVIARSRELAAANNGLRQANDKLAQLDNAKTAFFSNVSHEFRTPLTLMLGPLEDLLAQPLLPEDRERVSLAQDNALRLLKLVNTLLDFARLEAGRLRACYAPLDISKRAAELAGMFSSAASKASIELEVRCPPLSEPAYVDRDMWEKIVPNLISNAFKFTLDGKIGVRVEEQADRFALTVSDTGVGIPATELPKIFERFHRVEGSRGRTHEGTGIGLSLVRELVELHGGTVTVSSEVGRGSTFKVEIPKGFQHLPAESVSQSPADSHLGRDAAAYAAEAARWIASPTSQPPSRPASEGTVGRARVLVVDDNADLRTYIGNLLSELYQVSTANDGQQALDAIRSDLPDLVVSDVMMPVLDGFGLLRELRAEAKTAALPVILLSARAGEEAAIEGLDAGSDDYLAKPFSARELLARVRTHLEIQRARRAWTVQLEEANRELDSFSYSVSHDLRAPLRSIDGFSQALLEDYGDKLDDEGRKFLSRVRESAQRMAELIDGLLTLARVTRNELKAEAVDLSALALEVGEGLPKVRPDSFHRVELNVEQGLLAEGDPRLLRAVLENLLGNAWKFTAKNPRGQVQVGRAERDGKVAFFVRDNGVGFDMAYASKLFGAFQRLHPAAEFDGHGIGLATVQRIVRRHGGKIWAEGKVGEGATFYFTLDAASSVNSRT